MDIDDLTGASSTVALKFETGEGEAKTGMDMTIVSTYAEKVMEADIGMKLVGSGTDDILDMTLDYKLDGNKQSDNLAFNMTYDIAPPDPAVSMKLKVDAVGDYYVDGSTIMLNMDEINYGIDAGGSTPMSMNMSL